MQVSIKTMAANGSDPARVFFRARFLEDVAKGTELLVDYRYNDNWAEDADAKPVETLSQSRNRKPAAATPKVAQHGQLYTIYYVVTCKLLYSSLISNAGTGNAR